MIMIFKRLIVVILCLTCLAPASFAAESGSSALKAQDYLAKGEKLFKSHEWDESEKAYLKALKSPLVDDRIAAYTGLIELYRKVKCFRKAKRTEKKLEREKDFVRNLIPQVDDFYENYQVRAGDTYGKIARRNKISEEWLKRANQHQKLIEGKTIKVPKVRDALYVIKKERKIFWKREGKILKVYPVSVGHVGTETPEGEFLIVEKIKEPTWYHMKEVIPPGSPKNLLGSRWLGLNKKGYGIHGTRDPKSIGSAASHGCIRMHNADVEELFIWISTGTRVMIQ